MVRKKRATAMKAIELIGKVDDSHQLQVEIPETLPPGPVRIIVLIPEEDEAGAAWLHGIAYEWQEELNDPRNVRGRRIQDSSHAARERSRHRCRSNTPDGSSFHPVQALAGWTLFRAYGDRGIQLLTSRSFLQRLAKA
jgi:hypothetical protein